MLWFFFLFCLPFGFNKLCVILFINYSRLVNILGSWRSSLTLSFDQTNSSSSYFFFLREFIFINRSSIFYFFYKYYLLITSSAYIFFFNLSSFIRFIATHSTRFFTVFRFPKQADFLWFGFLNKAERTLFNKSQDFYFF